MVIAELAKSLKVTIGLDWSAKGTLLAYRLTCCWPFKCSALHYELVLPLARLFAYLVQAIVYGVAFFATAMP